MKYDQEKGEFYQKIQRLEEVNKDFDKILNDQMMKYSVILVL